MRLVNTIVPTVPKRMNVIGSAFDAGARPTIQIREPFSASPRLGKLRERFESHPKHWLSRRIGATCGHSHHVYEPSDREIVCAFVNLRHAWQVTRQVTRVAVIWSCEKKTWLSSY